MTSGSRPSHHVSRRALYCSPPVREEHFTIVAVIVIIVIVGSQEQSKHNPSLVTSVIMISIFKHSDNSLSTQALVIIWACVSLQREFYWSRKKKARLCFEFQDLEHLILKINLCRNVLGMVDWVPIKSPRGQSGSRLTDSLRFQS